MRVTYACGYGHAGSAQTHSVDVNLDDLPPDATSEQVIDALHEAVIEDIGRNASPADVIDKLDDRVAEVLAQLAARRPASAKPAARARRRK